MLKEAKFIWLNKDKYLDLQKSCVSIFSADRKKYRFGVAAFKKSFRFDKIIKKAEIEVFGDTRYYLWQNGKFVGTGPCPCCGDVDMPYQYSSKFVVDVEETYIDFYARVQLTPTVQTDNSKGKGGFILSARIEFEDGSDTVVYTDETWHARKETEFLSPWYVDYTKERDEWGNAALTECVWNVVPSQIKNLKEETVSSENFKVAPNSIAEFKVSLDKIYSAYSSLEIKANGEYKIELITAEKEGVSEKKHFIKGDRCESYRSNEYYAFGEYRLVAENKSDTELEIKSDVIFVCYPSNEKGYFKCSDDMLNRIYELGKWTVKICRQALELDSPVHQENLLCTGDYMIESLVNNYTTGDYSLTRFDILRMSQYLTATGGYMYNDNYPLIFPMWLYDYYTYSGDKQIFADTLGGLESVLTRFGNMENEKGLIENVAGYSFVDWTFIDGYSMYAPPRALGETVMNELYYNSLVTATKIYEILGMSDKAEYYSNKEIAFKTVFNEVFYDKEKGLYCDGLTEISASNPWTPENPEKKYYTRYSNTLAVLFGLCDKEKEQKIMEWVLKPENLEGVQPYFMHYVFEAVYKTGLFRKYGIELMKKWQVLVETCEKGMGEVWQKHEGYSTDYSHGWGATPTYQLPSKLLGLEILEPGFKKIRLNPDLYGLEWAEIKLPTPYGIIECNLKTGDIVELNIPEGIAVIY